ncbi:PLP-dependent transferase [Venturia nashicola]|uniref:PLP-dependent transferase n=1 Tax=Venturia nashicola TaxID=86259 RepID=A0A4Z1NY77_9PEZI|nr:PLP-dependent transferase [Venturia nashicola]TLD32552.1 PLP-dependent transferase [Venturia nashicola]
MNTYNVDIEAIRNLEYPNLKGCTYLDHGGTTIPAKSLSEATCVDLIRNLYGNPHSDSAPSRLSTARVGEIREQALRFFHADPDKYDLIFTANATSAIRLVGECLQDYAYATTESRTIALLGREKSESFRFGYYRDAHTSLVGLREFGDGKHTCLASTEEVEQWMVSDPSLNQPTLFAYPGQSNMTGRRLPLTWPKQLRNSRRNAYTILDAAALSMCSQLEIDRDEPDFTAVSFYKIFGMPDIGALIIRKDSAHMLQKRRYFGGGTVQMVIVLDATWHAKKIEDTVHDQLEEGTLPFHSIIALGHALDIHKRLFSSMAQISSHTSWLGQYAYNSMTSMRYTNGAPVFTIYKDEAAIYGDVKTQGATIAFNVLRPDSSLIPYTEVEAAADKKKIYVRSGAMCNAGGIATYLKWPAQDLRRAYKNGHRCNRPVAMVEGRATGVVRISLGAMSTKEDIDVFIKFVRRVYVNGAGALKGDVRSERNASLTEKSGKGFAKQEKCVSNEAGKGWRWLRRLVGLCMKG